MPIHLAPLNRRQFLAGVAAAGTALAVRDLPALETGADPDAIALVSDSHIAANPREVLRGANMHDQLASVLQEIIQSPAKPCMTLHSGDCAYLTGQRDDYEQLAKLLDPLRAAGIPIHMGMGNHDNRERFAEALADYRPQDRPLEGRYVSVIATRRANWFLLDSLIRTNVTAGELGKEQLNWLDKALASHADKPALVVFHHDLNWTETGEKRGELIDTLPLFAILRAHKQVKATFFGHSHNWQIAKWEGIHLVNLPPTAYVFDPRRPSGWVSIALQDDGAELVLHALNRNHPEHGQKMDLKWRA